MKSWFTFFSEFKKLVGKEVMSIFWKSVGIGICWFLVETYFVFVLQFFFLSIGLTKSDQTQMPINFLTPNPETAFWVLLIYGILRFVVVVLKGYFSNICSQLFIKNTREKILNYSLRHAYEVNSHQMMAIFSERVAFTGSSLQQLAILINVSVSLLFFMAFGLYLAPKQLILGLTLLVVFILPLKLFSKTIDVASRNITYEWESICKFLIQGIRNFYYIKVSGKTDFEIQNGSNSLNKYKNNYEHYYKISSIRGGFPTLIGVFVIAGLTFYSIKIDGLKPMVLVSFFYVFIRIAQCLSEINTAFSDLSLQKSGISQLIELNKTISEKELTHSTQKALSLSKIDIFKIENLKFAYPNQLPLFDEFNLSLTQGDRLLIRGESGVGKSTLISLLLGLLRPQDGQILVNENNIGLYGNNLFEKIAYVGPDPFLKNDTIRNNLLYGKNNTEISDQKLWEVLEIVNLRNTITENFEAGLNSVLNEHTQISTGQKQRLSIARALLKEADLLILDEATANVDAVNEKAILNYIYTQKYSFIVAITHKNTYEHFSNKKLILSKDGVIFE